MVLECHCRGSDSYSGHTVTFYKLCFQYHIGERLHWLVGFQALVSRPAQNELANLATSFPDVKIAIVGAKCA
jgi:hypothetical protein